MKDFEKLDKEFEKLDKDFEEILNEVKSTKEKDKELIEKSNKTIPYDEAVELDIARKQKEKERLAQPYTLTVEEYEKLIKRIEELERTVKYDCVKVTYGTI